MLHADSQERSARLAQVLEILKREAPAEERELVLALTPILFAGMPARIGLRLPPEVVAARILKLHYPFIAREMPPAHQLYKGLPGIHVGAANLSEEDSRRIGGGAGLPLETTILRTHTPDRPFIFDSLKNYLQKSGLRVYAAFHPIFTVRRQWERVAAFGDAQAEGSKESYCLFHIEPLPSKEQLRRIEHEVFALLKAVFLAVDDFKDMGRACRELAPRLRARRGDAAELASARAFLEWLQDDNYVFMGTLSYAAGPDGVLVARGRDGDRRLQRPGAAPGGVPGCRGARRGAPAPAAERRPHPRPRLLRQRLRDLPPRADRGPDGAGVGRGRQAHGPDAAARAFRARGLRAARRPHPAAQGEARPHPRALRRGPELAHLARDARHLQPLPQDRPLLRRGLRPRARDPEDRRGRERRRARGREPEGARATRRSTWRSRGCATRTRSRRRCGARSSTPSARSPSRPRSTAGR